MAKNKTTERWLEVVSELKAQNVVDSDVSLSKSVHGLTKQKMYNMRVGDNGVKLEILEAFFESYPQVNANYILTGKGNMFLNNEEKMESSTDIGALGLTYDELARFYETTVSRYERLIEDMKIKFEALENAFRDAKETFDGRESA